MSRDGQEQPAQPGVEIGDTERGRGERDLARALVSVQVRERRQKNLSLRPWLLFERVPRNHQAKKDAYGDLRAACRARRAAREHVHEARRAGDSEALARACDALAGEDVRWQAAAARVRRIIVDHAWRGDALGQRYEAWVHVLTERIAALERGRGANGSGPPPHDAGRTAELARLQGERARVAAARAARYLELEAYADSLDYDEVPIERSVYEITVDGEPVVLRDHVDAYATVFASGFEGGAVNEVTPSQVRGRDHGTSTVSARLAASGLSDSVTRILGTIAESEGGFTTINSYDKAVLTWGFLQWTGGAYSELTQSLAVIAKRAPAAFARRLGRYGIDVRGRKLMLRLPDGTALAGDEAARRIGQDPVLAAVLARAGLDEDIQRGQIEAAVRRQIDHMLARPVVVRADAFPGLAGHVPAQRMGRHGIWGKLPIRIGDLITSEYGVGVLCDHAIHGGAWGAARAVGMGVEAYLKERALDPLDPTSWANTIEPHLWHYIIAGWTERAERLRARGASQAPGSFRR